MSKKSSQRIIQSLLRVRLHYHQSNKRTHSFHTSYCSSTSTVVSTNGYFNSINSRSQILSKLHFDPLSSKSNAFSNMGLSHFSQRGALVLKHDPLRSLSPKSLAFVRGFSSGAKDVKKTVFGKQAEGFKVALARHREALVLQLEGFWKRNYVFILGTGGVVLCGFLWRVMFRIANTVVGFSEGMAEYGFLTLSMAIVAFSGLYIRSRLTINPDKIYRMAMRKLNTSAEVLEVMGAPLSGSDLRAYVMSGGGITLKTFKPALRSKRCFLIFPVQGSEMKGLASVEAKKKKGQYDIKLLAVDIPMASGPERRLYLIGDEEEYNVGGGLISELRDPIVKAMTAIKEFDDLDLIEDEEDAARELEEQERKRRENSEKLKKVGQE